MPAQTSERRAQKLARRSGFGKGSDGGSGLFPGVLVKKDGFTRAAGRLPSLPPGL